MDYIKTFLDLFGIPITKMDYIDNIYVINLDRSEDRWSNFNSVNKNRIKNHTFIRISGIDGNQLSKKDLDSYKLSTLCKYFCTPEIIGCALSHKKVWQTMLHNNDRHCVIMEDDCEVVDDFEQHVSLVMNEVLKWDPDYDIIYLGCFGGCDENKNYGFFDTIQTYAAPNIKREHPLVKLNRNKYIYIPESPIGLHCYILSQKGAEKLIQIIDKVRYHVDVQIMWNNKHLNVWASKKKLGIQRATNENSLLSGTHKFPILLNRLLDNIVNDNNISTAFYLGSPIVNILGYNVNFYTIIFILATLLYKPTFKMLLIYFLIELITTQFESIVPVIQTIPILWLVSKYSLF